MPVNTPMKRWTKEQMEEISKGIRMVVGGDAQIGVYNQRRIPKTQDYVMVYQAIGRSILEGNLGLSTCKVFFYLICFMEFENFIGIDQLTLSEKLRIPLPTIKKAMCELRDLGMLISIKNNHDRRRLDYRLNPIAAWKGKVTNRQKRMIEDPMQLKIGL